MTIISPLGLYSNFTKKKKEKILILIIHILKNKVNELSKVKLSFFSKLSLSVVFLFPSGRLTQLKKKDKSRNEEPILFGTKRINFMKQPNMIIMIIIVFLKLQMHFIDL